VIRRPIAGGETELRHRKRSNTEFILAGVLNSGNDIDPAPAREDYNSRQLQHREDSPLEELRVTPKGCPQ
jgi:hypothetical protein